MPSYGGGRPPKLDEEEQDELLELLRDDQPWKSQEIQHLLHEEFGVEYHSDYLGGRRLVKSEQAEELVINATQRPAR